MKTSPEQQITLEILFAEISELKKALLHSPTNSITPDCIPRADAMKFLSYKDTQIAALEKSGQITVSKVGKRKFIHRQSLIRLIQDNIQAP